MAHSIRKTPATALLLCSLCLTALPRQATAYTQKDLETLTATNRCVECDLSGADLRRAKLAGAHLERANLSRANLAGADLEGANLKAVDLRGANLIDANLGEADFYKADLTGAFLKGANLKNAFLANSNHDLAILEGTTYTAPENALKELKKVLPDPPAVAPA
ncbi:MAG: pentapeptide repeat-containing protein, partial [Desulfobulbaceae bacterium]|nr:pentapeptide repeat-containing protein [Desulfobulbaceae bacterium]HIJ91302.1 pentapeptide repeat-containing protein [Deltaproteobacteria bacterium]